MGCRSVDWPVGACREVVVGGVGWERCESE